MEEKALITSSQYNAKKILRVFLVIAAIVALLLFVYMMNHVPTWSWWDNHYDTYKAHQKAGTCGRIYKDGLCPNCKYINEHPSRFLDILDSVLTYYYDYFIIPTGAVCLLGVIVYFWLRSYELTITNKRVFGRIAWGKRVDLPVDSVSAISTISFLKGISVSTASGKISFLLIKNANEVYKVINDLLISRQQAQKTTVQTEKVNGSADELKKYKDLLDSGVITQEEFDSKKKQLLGL